MKNRWGTLLRCWDFWVVGKQLIVFCDLLDSFILFLGCRGSLDNIFVSTKIESVEATVNARCQINWDIGTENISHIRAQ